MGKYGNIDLGRFDELWSSRDKLVLQTFIDDSAMLKNNYTFWRENFELPSSIIAPDADGAMSFTVRSKVNEPDGMADFKGSSLAKNTGIDLKGSTAYSGSLPFMGKALNPVTVLDREQKSKIVAQFGSDSRLVLDYIENIQMLKNYVDSRISNMAGQVMSTGRIVGINANSTIPFYGIDAMVPTENRVNAGTKAWTDTTCNLLDQMAKIEKDYRERTGDESPRMWQITRDTWRNVFLTNTKLKEDLIAYRKLREMPTSSGGTVLEEWVVEYINTLGITDPIQIVTEGEIEKGISSSRAVKGWEDKFAVYRPTGYAGRVLAGEILKAKLSSAYASNSMERMVAYMDGGIMALINSVDHSGEFPIWLTDIESCAAPVLTEAPYHVIVDTTQAD